MLTGYRFFSPNYSFHIKFKKQKKVKTFPLLKLPYFPLKDVINQLDFFTVIHLSMLSNTFKNSLGTAKLDVDHMRFLFTANSSLIEISKGIHRLGMEAYCGDMEWVYLKLNGKMTPIHETVIPRYTYCFEVMAESPESKLEVMEKITKHLCSITSPNQVSVRFHRELDFKNLFLWNYVKRLENLKIFAPSEYSCLLPSEQPKLIPEGSWKCFDVLPSGFTCKTLEFEIDGVPYKEINKLVKDWIAGKYENLEELNFRFPFFYPRDDSPVFDGINAEPSSFPGKQLLTRLRHFPYALRPPVDIKRSGDGRIGTLVMTKRNIVLYVWHQKHLDKLGQIEEDCPAEIYDFYDFDEL